MARYENGEETRQLILRSAGRLIYEKGLENITFKELADSAHVSRTSVIYHFGNKTNISAELAQQLFTDSMQDVSDILQTDRFSYMIASYIFWHQYLTDEKYRRWVLSTDDASEDELERWMETIYDALMDSFGLSQSLEEFSRENSLAGAVLCGMEMQLCIYVNSHLDQYRFYEVAEEEMGIMARVFRIPEKQISAYLKESRRVLQLVDFTQFVWKPRREEL